MKIYQTTQQSVDSNLIDNTIGTLTDFVNFQISIVLVLGHLQILFRLNKIHTFVRLFRFFITILFWIRRTEFFYYFKEVAIGFSFFFLSFCTPWQIYKFIVFLKKRVRSVIMNWTWFFFVNEIKGASRKHHFRLELF